MVTACNPAILEVQSDTTMTKEILIPGRVSFPIANVEPSKERLPQVTIRAALEQIAQTQLISCLRAEQHVLAGEQFHPLIAAAAIAYKQHFPLVLSPDMLWVTVLQGVAQHI